MKGYLFISDKKIGEISFTIIDEPMGVIGGNLITNKNYEEFKSQIQQNYKDKGISNLDDFEFKILFKGNYELMPEGGIGVIDYGDIDEIYVEVSGLDISKLT